MKLLELLNSKKTRRRIPSNRRKVVYERDGKRCRYCGDRVEYHLFHLDHIVPVAHNGNDFTFNLCCACPKCNMSKGANKRIVPKELPLWRQIYGIALMWKYKDMPTIEDFV